MAGCLPPKCRVAVKQKPKELRWISKGNCCAKQCNFYCPDNGMLGGSGAVVGAVGAVIVGVVVFLAIGGVVFYRVRQKARGQLPAMVINVMFDNPLAAATEADSPASKLACGSV
jgi:hypothetical protein